MKNCCSEPVSMFCVVGSMYVHSGPPMGEMLNSDAYSPVFFTVMVYKYPLYSLASIIPGFALTVNP